VSKKEPQDTFEQLDQTKFGWLHVRAILVAGIGFFCDAYDLFVINLVVPMISFAYYDGHTPAIDETFMKGAAVIGTFIGQLVFGVLGDVFGRKAAYGVSLGLMIVGAITSAMSSSTVRGMNVVVMLSIWRFVLGIGIGGDYPLSAVITSEYATVNTRGRMIGAVFALQGIGQLTAAIVSLIVISCFKNAIIRDPLNTDYVWRICIGLGCVPAVLGAYYRAKLPETPRYTAHVKGNRDLAMKDINAVLTDKTQVNEVEDATPLPRKGVPGRITTADFINHYSKWKNLKVLLGCSLSWFMLDVAFYGLSLNQSVVLTQIGYTKSKKEPYEYLFSLAVGNCLINLMGSVPGYWFTVWLVEIWGRVKIQLMGFVIVAIIFLILSAGYNAILKETTALFIVLYCLAQFFFNFGPNSTTFIIPGEVFPTRYRSTSHGICAATGKLGAIISSFGFTYLVNVYTNGVQLLLGIFVIFMAAGVLTTLLIPETKGISLEEISENPEDV